MKPKAVIWTVIIAVFAAALAAVIVIRHNTVGKNDDRPYSIPASDAPEAETEFILEGSDRLCGYPATDYKADGSTVKITYADAGYITKTLGETDGGAGGKKYAETAEQEVDGRTVTFKGNDGAVCFAVWHENGFTYTISVKGGANAEEMIEYVKATR